jgi:DNA-binding transcriptional regulator YiaG
MTPREVEGIRTRLGMTRAAFAELTRLGEASLARWEKGLLIQNPGNDQLLYLLQFPENVKRLRSRLAATDSAARAGSSSRR